MIVLNPPGLTLLIVAIPTSNLLDWITSALKVVPTPTTPPIFPWIDETSDSPKLVIAVATLLFVLIPLNWNSSFNMKVPVLS